MRAVLAYLFCLSLFGLAGTARAHDAFPLLVALSHSGDDLYTTELTLPPSIAGRVAAELQMPSGCRRLAGERHDASTRLYRCAAGLGGQEIELAYTTSVPSVPVLVRIAWPSGEIRTLLLPPGETRFTVPGPESAVAVVGQYLRLGIEHILRGYDHLLVLVCLLWLAGTPRRLVLTITGFTLAHSMTLVLSALDVIRLPIPPVEASIALSILFLAVEIFKGRRDSLTWRYPIAVSAIFGLLHGLGFAAVLEQIGLPQIELVAGLLSFNLGVEIGQLIFVAVVIGFYFALRRLGSAWTYDIGNNVRFRRASSAMVGVLASYWLVDRTASFLN